MLCYVLAQNKNREKICDKNLEQNNEETVTYSTVKREQIASYLVARLPIDRFSRDRRRRRRDDSLAPSGGGSGSSVPAMPVLSSAKLTWTSAGGASATAFLCASIRARGTSSRIRENSSATHDEDGERRRQADAKMSPSVIFVMLGSLAACSCWLCCRLRSLTESRL